MDIKEVITIENGTERSQLYSIFIDCARGNFAEIVNGDDKAAIERAENLFKKHFDEFATDAFNMGRKYEASRVKD